MPSKRTPTQRGYKQVMLNSQAAQALAGFCADNGGLSASAAVVKLIGEGVSILPDPPVESVSIHPVTPAFTPDDLERMFLACRLTDGAMQGKIRFWFSQMLGWDE